MYGRVVDTRARHNLCFGPRGQEPDYENGKGRVVAYADVPMLDTFRTNLPSVFGPKANDLVIEGNYYYDITKCGIRFHGDAERRKVIALRLGSELPLEYQWFQHGKPVGERLHFTMQHGCNVKEGSWIRLETSKQIDIAACCWMQRVFKDQIKMSLKC